MRVVVTEIGWDGSIRRRVLDTSCLTGAGRWEDLIEQVLAVPPPYRAAPGSSVYVIHAGDHDPHPDQCAPASAPARRRAMIRSRTTDGCDRGGVPHRPGPVRNREPLITTQTGPAGLTPPACRARAGRAAAGAAPRRPED